MFQYIYSRKYNFVLFVSKSADEKQIVVINVIKIDENLRT